MLIIAASRLNKTDIYDYLPIWAWGLAYRYNGYGKWIAAIPMDLRRVVGTFPVGSCYNDGWNGSFHDCYYTNPMVIAWGSSPSRARKRLKRALEFVQKNGLKKDPCSARFEARQAVREGD